MSMPALLSHFGIDDARYVTSTGLVVFDGVTSPVDGVFQHEQFGAVTPVAEHAFHGDVPEPSDVAGSDRRWWEDRSAIDRHIVAMSNSFPDFVFLEPTEDLNPCWCGTIDTGRGRFEVAIILRADEGLPSVVVLGKRRLGINQGRRWVKSPHLYLNGNLCIASADDWISGVHTAATATAWAAHWLAAYTEWRITKQWPVDGAGAAVA
ncbi:hypothetical protein [Gordonia sp. NPDC127522]|uniref:hypothetical protein n=1 Tax=Gordonia sp. NPDC127522 TaxID=3345390 RepID=UPI00364278DE